MQRKMHDVDEIIACLVQAVLDYGPDWVDPNGGPAGTAGGCRNRYTHNGVERMCIAGHVLWQLGCLPSNQLLSAKTTELQCNSVDVRTAVILYDAPLTHPAIEVLVWAQSAQDRGCTWGEALAEALTKVRETRLAKGLSTVG